MATQHGTETRRGCGRLFFRCAILVLLAVFAGFASFLTGVPQRLGAQYLLASQLNARVGLASVSLKNPLVVQGLTLADRAAELYGPLLHMDSARVAYDWRPGSPRHIQDVTLSGIRLSLQQGETEKNFQFLIDRFSGPGGETSDVTPWIPEHVNVDQLWIELNFPSFYLRMDNLGFQAALDSISAGSATFGSPNTGIAWSSAYAPGGHQSGSGSLSFDAEWDGADVDVEAEIDLGALAHARGMATVIQRDGQPYYALSLPDVHLEDPLWSAALTDLLPVSVRFDSLSLQDTDIHVHQTDTGIIVDQASADASLTGVSIGPTEAPYYEGPVKLEIHGNYGDDTKILGTVDLQGSPAAKGDFQWMPGGVSGAFSWEPWSRDALAQLTPPDYAVVLDVLKPLKSLGATGSLTQSPGAVTVSGSLLAAFGERDPVKIPLEIAYASTDTGSHIDLKSDVALKEERIESAITVLPDQPVSVKNKLTKVDVNRWTSLLLGSAMVPGFAGALTGNADLSVSSGQPVSVDLDITADAVRYGEVSLPTEHPVALIGPLAYHLDTSRIEGKAIKLVQEGFFDLAAPSWSLDLSKATLKAAPDATLSLDSLSAMFGLTDPYGDARISGKLTIGPEQITLGEFSAFSDNVGYGDSPYGLTLNLDGNVDYQFAANMLRLEPVTATLGEGTKCRVDALGLHLPNESDPFSLDAAGLALNTDLDVLIRWGLLEEVADGRATLTSDKINWGGDTLSGLLIWDIAANHLALTDKMAAFEDFAWQGRYNPGDAEDGGGRLTASSVAVYDMPFGAVDTHLKISAEKITCNSLTTTFLDGNLTLSGETDYHDPAFRSSLDGKVEHLDLARFTETFEPPDVILTGKVSGAIDMVLSTEGLVDLNVDLTATDNLSLNRAMVREILMSQYVNEAVGSKSVQKIIEKVIGKDEQRPFDKAVLQLRLEDGLIRGEARLESKSLDVTVDINAEPKAILEAIRSSTESN